MSVPALPPFLETRVMTGATYDKLIGFAFHPDTELASWFTPIDFVGRTLRLYQPLPGPCGLFAVLQAQILMNHKHNPEIPTLELLLDSVLDVMSRLRGGNAFIFCQMWSRRERILVFVSTSNRRATRTFLSDSGLLQTRIAAILVVISFVCLAGAPMLSSFSIAEPMIYRDGQTTVPFVLLLITGNVADSAAQDFRVVGSVMYTGVMTTQDIGYLIQDEAQAQDREGESLAHPKEQISVRFFGGHFDAIMYADPEFRLFDPYDRTPAEWIPIKSVNPIYERLVQYVKADK
jgi:hypothetical protein